MSQELLSTEKCGVFGMVGTRVFTEDFARGFCALQHRGGDAAGILSLRNGVFEVDHTVGGIDTLFEQSKTLKTYTLLVGHNRYTTSEGMSLRNAQPFLLKHASFSLSLAHNGNIPKEFLKPLKKIFKTPLSEGVSDSFVMTKVLLEARSTFPSWMETFVATLPLFKGAFSLVCVTEEGFLYAIRDPWGVRPLCLGKKGSAWVVASETTTLDAMGATYAREVLPGEVVCIKPDGSFSSILYGKHAVREHRCLLETIYFSKNKSFDGRSFIWEQRRSLGRSVAARFAHKNIPVDLIVPILNSGKDMAIGASEVLGMVNTEAIHVTGTKRSFIQNTDETRKRAVNEKHIVDAPLIRGRRLALCDDSLVRGISLQVLIAKIREVKEHAPSEIHILLGSQPVVDICDLGVDLPRKNDLLAASVNGKTQKQIERRVAEVLGVASVTYLDASFVEAALGRNKKEMCWHCFGGPHPIKDSLPPMYRKNKQRELGKQKVLFFASGSGSNVANLLESIKDGRVLAQAVGVITNKEEAGVIAKADAYGVQTYVIPSKGKLLDIKRREHYEQELLRAVLEKRPDIIVLAGWMIVLSDIFLQTTRECGIEIINIHPSLLSGNGSGSIRTSVGVVPEVRGAHVLEEIFSLSLDKMPVSGVTVHHVVEGGPVDTGEIVLTEEVPRLPKESLEAFITRTHQAEYRTFPVALQKVILERIAI